MAVCCQAAAAHIDVVLQLGMAAMCCGVGYPLQVALQYWSSNLETAALVLLSPPHMGGVAAEGNARSFIAAGPNPGGQVTGRRSSTWGLPGILRLCSTAPVASTTLQPYPVPCQGCCHSALVRSSPQSNPAIIPLQFILDSLLGTHIA